jgi:hypothetical protein
MLSRSKIAINARMGSAPISEPENLEESNA